MSSARWHASVSPKLSSGDREVRATVGSAQLSASATALAAPNAVEHPQDQAAIRALASALAFTGQWTMPTMRLARREAADGVRQELAATRHTVLQFLDLPPSHHFLRCGVRTELPPARLVNEMGGASLVPAARSAEFRWLAGLAARPQLATRLAPANRRLLCRHRVPGRMVSPFAPTVAHHRRAPQVASCKR